MVTSTTMKPVSKRFRLGVFASCLMFSSMAFAAVNVPSPPDLPVKGYILVDFASGNELAASNADERLEPASLTKLMTAYVVFKEIKEGRLKLTDVAVITPEARKMEGSRTFLEVGASVDIETLLKGLIIQSGNDAAVALAERVAGSINGFADMMNREARRLGMKESHFVNPHGLPDPEHYITARDISLLARALIEDFPEFYPWYKEKEFTYNKITQANRNPLLRLDPNADGMKTGYTDKAGYCLVGSIKRDNMRLISVVMGSSSMGARARNSLSLLNYGFQFFESDLLYKANQELEQLRIRNGQDRYIKVGPKHDVLATIPKGSYGDLSAELVPEKDIVAPVKQGQTVGKIILKQGGKEIARFDAVALADNPEGNFLRRMYDSVTGWFF